MSKVGQQLNLPNVIAQVRAEFERYEAALRANDVELLNLFFLDSPQVVRFGIAEHSYGIDALRAYRRQAPPLPPGRQLQQTIITTMGDDAASVCTEFVRADSPMVGRQSQMWIRTDQGWKIIAAHVSEVSAAVLRRA